MSLSMVSAYLRQIENYALAIGWCFKLQHFFVSCIDDNIQWDDPPKKFGQSLKYPWSIFQIYKLSRNH
jgi:hypothetical protein